MRKGLLIPAALFLFLIATPAVLAQNQSEPQLTGTWSLGLGAGSGGDNVAPYVLSGKYWDPSWELGVDAFTVFKQESNEDDQLYQAWLAYKYTFGEGGDSGIGGAYAGIGASGIFKAGDEYSNSFGGVIILGWDSDVWGVEAKAGYYDPFLYSFVVYYHFSGLSGL